jgi:hypothetical protein
MPRGRPPKLVSEVYENWPIEAAPCLPWGLRGIYVLYDPHWVPIRIGISGRGAQDVKGRILGDYYRSRNWRNAHHFSVFVFANEILFKQAEVLILRAVGQAIRGNVHSGSFMATTKIRKPPRVRYPAHFLERFVPESGTLALGKYAGRKLRIEVGPPKSKVP